MAGFRAAIPTESIATLSALLDKALAEAPRLMSSVAALYRDPTTAIIAEGLVDWFWQSPIPSLYRENTGDEPGLLVEFTTIQRHTPGRSETRVSWHVDANFIGASGTQRVVWVPVDTVGRDAPGLEFAIPQKPVLKQTISEQFTIARPNGGVLTDQNLQEIFGDSYRSWRPVLEPGDCVMFDQWAVHRTDPQLDAAPRTAIEFRMYSLTDPPKRALEESNVLVSSAPGYVGPHPIHSATASA